jgi:alkylation response protein AidB-like acyl-CoA dehydrogenase
VGCADAALGYAAIYAAERIQFGRPIGKFESLARLQDFGETLVLGARMLVLRAALLLDQVANDAAFEAVSRARDFTSMALARAAIDAVQIYGGYGFVNDFPVEKLMRDARAFDAYTGDEAFERVLGKVA